MASLTEHLRRPDDHGRLGFHPECPICCSERLAGPLPSDAVVGRRTQALLAAGVLALSTATPAAALATEPDQEQEGVAAPDQVAAEDVPADSESDPGGQATELPFEKAQAPVPDAAPDTADDGGPMEDEPTTDEDAPVADLGDGSGMQTASAEPVEAESAPPPPAPAIAPPPQAATPVASPPSTPPPSAPAEEAPVGLSSEAQTATQSATGAIPRSHAGKPDKAREKQHRHPPVEPAPTYRPAPAPQPIAASSGTSVAAAAVTISAPATVSHRRTASRDDRFHVVEPGESLWSIAKDELGAAASAARIARKVNRLWELNSSRIGTGDRNLLLVGTKLVLR